MTRHIVYAFMFLCLFLMLVATAHVLYKSFQVSPEHSRKFLHVSGGFLALCSPLFFTSHWWVLILCSLAFLLLLFTYLKNWLPAIHLIERRSIGSVIYPVPVYLCFLAASQKNNDLLFYLPISLLTISDTVAELGGKKWSNGSGKLMNGQKSIAGSLCFAVSALLISITCGYFSSLALQEILVLSIAITLITTLTEIISTKGLDNITVPLITLICLLLLND